MQPDLSARESSLIWIFCKGFSWPFLPHTGISWDTYPAKLLNSIHTLRVFLCVHPVFQWLICEQNLSLLTNFLWEEEFSFVFGIWLLIPLDTGKILFKNIKCRNCIVQSSTHLCLGQLWAGPKVKEKGGPGWDLSNHVTINIHPWLSFVAQNLLWKSSLYWDQVLTRPGTPCFSNFK